MRKLIFFNNTKLPLIYFIVHFYKYNSIDLLGKDIKKLSKKWGRRNERLAGLVSWTDTTP